MSYQGITFALMIGVAIGTAIYYYFKNDNNPYAHRYVESGNEYEYYDPEPSRSNDSLPRRRRRNSITSHCSICLEKLNNGKKTRQINCDHLFHQHCIDTWLKSSKTCPICRQEQM